MSKKDKRKKKKRGKKGRREDGSDDEVRVPRPVVDTSMGEMPEGATISDGEEEGKKKKKKPVEKDERYSALDQNLDA